MKTIDLNCDLGEWKDQNGPQKDASIMPYISSCNIACGGHIGDEDSMFTTIKLARDHGVAIGAHPSYPDKENFGRRVLDLSPNELEKSVSEQLKEFYAIVEKCGCKLHHIKPHGALYNKAFVDEEVAKTVVQAISSIHRDTSIYCQQGSKLADAVIEAGFRPVFEVFADRTYEDDLTLRSRLLEGAVIHNQEDVFAHIHRMVMDGKVKTITGSLKPIRVHTLCLHSDTEGAIHLAKQIHDYLKAKGVDVASF